MRFLVAGIGGLGVALLLFLVMHALITDEGWSGRSVTNVGIVGFVEAVPEETTLPKTRKPPVEPPPPQAPPPSPRLAFESRLAPPAEGPGVRVPGVSVPATALKGPYVGAWSAGDPAAEGDVIPIVRVEPRWPREALLEGTEGWVRVEFTILEDGSVTDAVVLDSEPGRLFDREAVRAVLKWRFKPRVIDGKAVARRATQRIDFVLDAPRAAQP
jgi:protein TonB